MQSLVSRMVHPHFFITGLFLVFLVLMAGCSSPQGPGQQASSCGNLSLVKNGRNTVYLVKYDGQRPKAIEQCFVQAFQQCQSLSLTISVLEGVDTSTTTTYTIQPKGAGCQISSSAQFMVAGSPNKPPATTNICQELTQTKDALVLTRCGGSEEMIPRKEFCGGTYAESTPGGNTAAENCFAQDYQECYPAVLTYSLGGGVVYQFEETSSCTLTEAVNGLPEAPCASLTQQADGLYVRGCRAIEDTLIPANP